MDGYRRILRLSIAVGLLSLSGASCPQVLRQYGVAPPPRALPPSPTLEQIIQVVNANNSQIQSLSTNQATISSPGVPALRASVAFQRPQRLRVRADTALTGPELDLGSNDELFWFWIRRSDPPAVYFCRHNQYGTSQIQRLLPIEPQWLIESLGATGFDPSLPHQGPFPVPNDPNRLMVRTVRETARGTVTKSTVVDAALGVVVEQHVYDAQGRLTASAITDHHRRDPLTGLYVPTVVKVHCPSAQFSMRLDLGNVQVNRLSPNSMEPWTMPVYQGAQVVDLCDPNTRSPAAGPPGPVSDGRGPGARRGPTW